MWWIGFADGTLGTGENPLMRKSAGLAFISHRSIAHANRGRGRPCW
jgi:hypothetical protein